MIKQTNHTPKINKEEVFFIATKYKSNPTMVDFFTRSGKKVPQDIVEKKRTKDGVKFFAML